MVHLKTFYEKREEERKSMQYVNLGMVFVLMKWKN